MNNIGIFSFARKQSQRCPNKMLRPFADTTLTDILLLKLKEIGPHSFFAGYEKEFKEKCKNAGVRFVKRSKKSINTDEPITEILSFLKNEEYDYFLIVNACLPFLRTETIKLFLKDCIINKMQPAFSVILRNNFFITKDHEPINFSLRMKTINTKTVEPIYEFAHALYFFNKKYFFENGRYWDWRKVRFIEIPNKTEAMDIDTEEDFLIVERIYKNKKKEGLI
jgi:CMP-N-acetylneuraminic acid synthetase